MGRMPLGMYLWPGLPQLSKEGNWFALGWAVGSAALLNLAIIASLVWSELVAPEVRNLVWGAVVLVWAVSAFAAHRWDRRQTAWHASDPLRDALAAAQDHYLKGNWFEAERILTRMLADDPRDVDAGLMRATMYRHTGRYDEAVGELDRIERFEGCRKWELEIRRERELIVEAKGENAEPAAATAASEPTKSTGPTEPTQSISDAA